MLIVGRWPAVYKKAVVILSKFRERLLTIILLNVPFTSSCKRFCDRCENVVYICFVNVSNRVVTTLSTQPKLRY